MAIERYDIGGVFIVDVVNIQAFNPDGTLRFSLNEITDFTLANTSDSTDVVGRGNTILKRIKSNKQSVLTATSGLYSIPLLETSSGGVLQGNNGEGVRTKINIPEDIIVDTADQATISYKAVSITPGNEIIEIRAFLPGTGGSGLILTQAATTSPTHFTYDPDEKLIEFATGTIPVGTKLVVYYNREIMAVVLENNASSFAGTYMTVINLVVEDECDKQYKARIIMPRGQFDDNYDITGGNTIGTQSVSISALKQTGNCPGIDLRGTDQLWSLVIFHKDVADAV